MTPAACGKEILASSQNSRLIDIIHEMKSQEVGLEVSQVFFYHYFILTNKINFEESENQTIVFIS